MCGRVCVWGWGGGGIETGRETETERDREREGGRGGAKQAGILVTNPCNIRNTYVFVISPR